MIGAQKRLGVDVMTGALGVHLRRRARAGGGRERLGPIEFLAQNVRTTDFGDPVFPPYALRTVNGVPVAIIGQAFPYTPIANPRHFVPDWTFGIQDERLQSVVDEVRAKGAQAVVLLSHNGMDVDLKLAVARARHRRDPRRPHPRRRAARADRRSARRWSPTPARNGKFLGVLDLEVRQRRRDRLPLPAAAGVRRTCSPADPAMARYIAAVRSAVRGKAGRDARA